MSADAPDDARPRLFVAFRLPAHVVQAVAAWQRQAFDGVTGIRSMPARQFHVTAVFLGSQPADRVYWIRETVGRLVAEAPSPVFRIDRYRETSRVGMLTLREEPLPGYPYAGRGSEVVGRLMLAFEAAGIYRRENRDWRPHVTVARFKEAPRLKLTPPPLEPFRLTEVSLFQSLLGANGSTYVEQGSYAFRVES